MRKFLLLAAAISFTMAFAFKDSHRNLSSHTISTGYAVKKEPLLFPRQTGRYKFGDYLIVTSKNASIRKGAGSDFEVVQTINKNGLLKYLSSNGNWHKVMVVGTERVGYVYYRNVK